MEMVLLDSLITTIVAWGEIKASPIWKYPHTTRVISQIRTPCVF